MGTLLFIYYVFLKASQAWMEWLIKKRKAFDQRGDMAIAAWAEQQQREMNLRARQRARSKVFNLVFPTFQLQSKSSRPSFFFVLIAR